MFAFMKKRPQKSFATSLLENSRNFCTRKHSEFKDYIEKNCSEHLIKLRQELLDISNTKTLRYHSYSVETLEEAKKFGGFSLLGNLEYHLIWDGQSCVSNILMIEWYCFHVWKLKVSVDSSKRDAFTGKAIPTELVKVKIEW